MIETRCCALNAKGTQCREDAIGFYSYHGESELYYGSYDDPHTVAWVLVPFYGDHVQGIGETHKKAMKRMKKEEKG